MRRDHGSEGGAGRIAASTNPGYGPEVKRRASTVPVQRADRANIFNKGCWATADGNNNISPGQPRTFRLTAIAKF
jgi:hypothetical protein